VKDPIKETAAQATAVVNQVKTEIGYGQGVAAAAKQGGGYNPWGGGQTLLGTMTSGLATPTTTAMGTPYSYYTDQANIAAGGTVSMQQQMGDYLQAEQSFGGDLGKLSKGRLNKNLMQHILAAGPLQGDQMAQSILSGQGGIGAMNKLWSQIGAESNKLGVQGMESVYGMPKGLQDSMNQLHGKSVTAAANVQGQAAVNALRNSINSLENKTVTIKLNVEVGGAGGGTAETFSPQQINEITSKVQSALLKQAKRNRQTGMRLQNYGS
jgi:hypothetical protein